MLDKAVVYRLFRLSISRVVLYQSITASKHSIMVK